MILNRTNSAQEDILGKALHEPHGDRIGTIEDLVLEPESGRVLFAIIKAKGFLGSSFNADYYPVPWIFISMNPNTHKLNINTRKEQVLNAPDFSLKELRSNDEKVYDKIFTYYGAKKIFDLYQKQREETFKTMDTDMMHIGNEGKIHQAWEGSSQISNQAPPDGNTRMGNEMSYDKLTKGTDKNKDGE